MKYTIECTACGDKMFKPEGMYVYKCPNNKQKGKNYLCPYGADWSSNSFFCHELIDSNEVIKKQYYHVSDKTTESRFKDFFYILNPENKHWSIQRGEKAVIKIMVSRGRIPVIAEFQTLLINGEFGEISPVFAGFVDEDWVNYVGRLDKDKRAFYTNLWENKYKEMFS